MASERVVMDASYVLESVLPTTRDDQANANALLAALASGDIKAVVPWIFYCEIAAACTKAVRGKRLDEADAVEFMDLLLQLGIDIEVKLDPPSDIFRTAMRIGAGTYDSMYVALAQAMDLPVATTDGGMRTALRSLKMPLFSMPKV